MKKNTISLCLILITLSIVCAQQRTVTPSQEVRDFVSVDAPVIALTHARVIDGTGAKALQDQTIIISDGKIQALGASSNTRVPEGAKVIDLTGKSVIPGLVLMHEHMFYPAGRLVLFNEMGFSFPRTSISKG